MILMHSSYNSRPSYVGIILAFQAVGGFWDIATFFVTSLLEFPWLVITYKTSICSRLPISEAALVYPRWRSIQQHVLLPIQNVLSSIVITWNPSSCQIALIATSEVLFPSSQFKPFLLSRCLVFPAFRPQVIIISLLYAFSEYCLAAMVT